MRIFDDTDPAPVAIDRVISDVSIRGQAEEAGIFDLLEFFMSIKEDS